MAVYIFIFLTLLSLLIFELSKGKKKRLFVICVMFLILFCGLRSGVGFDYDAYAVKLFKEDNVAFVEPGFMLITNIFRLTNNVHLYLFFIAFASLGLKGLGIFRISPLPFMSLLLYYSTAMLNDDMGKIRNGLAIAVAFWGIIQLANGKEKKFWLYSVMATMFHYSALAVLPLYFFRKIRLSNKMVLFISFFIMISLTYSMEKVFQYLILNLPLMGVVYRIEYYMSFSESGVVEELGLNLSILLRFFIFFFFFYTKNKCKDKSLLTNILFNGYLYGICLYAVLNSVPEFAGRASGYFKFLDIVILPYVYANSKGVWLKFISLGFVIFYSGYSLIKFFSDAEYYDQYIPYSNILFN